MEGFSYNGIHCGRYSVGYAPDPSAYFNNNPTYSVYDEDTPWHDGGYYFGNKTDIREFELDCYFEDITIATRNKILQWLDKNTSGKLIFDSRPFVYYNVRPSKVITGKIYPSGHGLYSGTFKVYFKAYNPFGFLMYKSYDDIDTDGVTQYCGMIRTGEMPPVPKTTDSSFLIYNCGTEIADTVIKLAGSAPNGLTITNEANNNVCTLTSLPDKSDYVEINSANGVVKSISGNDSTIAFEFHGDGYIRLVPCGMLYMDVLASYLEGSNLVSIQNYDVHDSFVGKYIFLNNSWMEITSIIDEHTLTISSSMSQSGQEETKIATMNKITISGEQVSLSKLEIDYVPQIQ